MESAASFTFLKTKRISSVIVCFRYTFADSKAACFYPGAPWRQRLAAADVLGPVLAIACSCRFRAIFICTQSAVCFSCEGCSDRELRGSWRKLAVLLCGMRGKVWGASTDEMDKFCSRCINCAIQLLQVRGSRCIGPLTLPLCNHSLLTLCLLGAVQRGRRRRADGCQPHVL